MSSTLFIKFLSTGLIVPGSYAAYSSGMFGGEFADDSDLSESLASLAYIHMPEEEEEAGVDSEGLVEDVSEKKKSASKRKLKIENVPTKPSDMDVYNAVIPSQPIAGSKLPSEFIGTYLYQAKDSGELEGNTKKFFCTNALFTKKQEDGISGEHPQGKARGPLNSQIDKGGSHPDDDMGTGCLDVIGGKEYYEGGKGRGGGRMMLTIQNYNYATMMMVTLEADNGKFMIEGNLYGMQYTNNNNKKGNILAQEQTRPREIKPENEEYLGIKPGDSVVMPDPKIKKGTGNGFELDRKNLCGASEDECTGDSTEASGSQALGLYNSSGNRKQSLDNWSSNYTKGSDSTKGLFKGFKKQHHDGIRGTLNLYGSYGGGKDLEGTSLAKSRTPSGITAY